MKKQQIIGVFYEKIKKKQEIKSIFETIKKNRDLVRNFNFHTETHNMRLNQIYIPKQDKLI